VRRGSMPGSIAHRDVTATGLLQVTSHPGMLLDELFADWPGAPYHLQLVSRIRHANDGIVHGFGQERPGLVPAAARRDQAVSVSARLHAGSLRLGLVTAGRHRNSRFEQALDHVEHGLGIGARMARQFAAHRQGLAMDGHRLVVGADLSGQGGQLEVGAAQRGPLACACTARTAARPTTPAARATVAAVTPVRWRLAQRRARRAHGSRQADTGSSAIHFSTSSASDRADA
jgi:hypothetical protein